METQSRSTLPKPAKTETEKLAEALGKLAEACKQVAAKQSAHLKTTRSQGGAK